MTQGWGRTTRPGRFTFSMHGLPQPVHPQHPTPNHPDLTRETVLPVGTELEPVFPIEGQPPGHLPPDPQLRQRHRIIEKLHPPRLTMPPRRPARRLPRMETTPPEGRHRRQQKQNKVIPHDPDPGKGRPLYQPPRASCAGKTQRKDAKALRTQRKRFYDLCVSA